MRRRRALGLMAAAVVAGCGELRAGPDGARMPGSTATPYVSPPATALPSAATLDDIVRSAQIRVGFNLAANGSTSFLWDGQRASGVDGEMADALAMDLRVRAAPFVFSSLALVLEAGRQRKWDIAFTGRVRSEAGIAFSQPHYEIDQVYLVAGTSPYRTPADADQLGSRIATFQGTALARELMQSLRRATVIETTSVDQGFLLVNSGAAQAVADGRATMANRGFLVPGGRVLAEPVTRIDHVIAVADGRADLFGFVDIWVEKAKRSGLVANMLVRHGAGAGTRVAGP